MRRVTALDTVVQRGGVTLASTLPGVGNRRFPRVGSVSVDDSEYRAASVAAPAFDGQTVRVSVLSDIDTVSDDIAAGRTLAVLILVGFLVLAFAFAFAVSRSLQGQIGRFLEGARRLGGGNFSTPGPTEGSDEFAELGQEFNAMAAELEARLDALKVPLINGEGTLRVTASFGVAAIPETAGDKDDLIAAADAALYRAKRAGKNLTERGGPAPRKTAPAIE